MNDIDRNYFEALTADREENAAVLEKASMRGVQRSVVEKYSEQAHFVYELIQNADDAGATQARFILCNDHLVFSHNGTRQFSVSDPTSEDRDRELGLLGDVNAITSIANSNKTEASIGKFGVGFKAVFQYTTTPHIYGEDLAFKIERFIVPKLLTADYAGRRESDTLFFFPFNKPDMSPKRAVQEIAKRLESLEYPILFLNSLEQITYETPSGSGCYKMSVDDAYTWDKTISAELITFTSNSNDSQAIERLWKLSTKGPSGYTSSVCFFVNEEGNLVPKAAPAFCFFPTKVVTDLQFIINAPFLLTDSREGIRFGELHNKRLIEELGELAGKAIPALRDIGNLVGIRIIDDSMFSVFPWKKKTYWCYSIDNDSQFDPIIDSVISVLRDDNVFPSTSGYWPAHKSFLVESQAIASLLDETRLRALMNDDDIGLILPSSPSASLPTGLPQFLRSIGVRIITEESLFSNISPGFIKQQDVEWLGTLHGFIAETAKRTEGSRQRIIFVDSQGQPCAAFDGHNKEQLFLPSQNVEGYRVLSQASLEQEGTKRLVDAFALKVPSVLDQLFNVVLPKLGPEGNARNESAFRAVFKCYKESDNRTSLAHDLSGYSFLAFRTNQGELAGAAKPSDLYFPTERLTVFFHQSNTAKFVDLNFYRSVIEDDATLLAFFRDLGVSNLPKLVSRYLYEYQANELARRTGIVWDYVSERRKSERTWHIQDLDGLAVALEYLSNNNDPDYSVSVWNILVSFIEEHCLFRPLSLMLTGEYSYFYYEPHVQSFDPLSVHLLRNSAWLFDQLGNRVAPSGLSINDISERFDTTSTSGQKLAEFLGLEEPESTEMSDGDRIFAEIAKKHGIRPDELMNDVGLRNVMENYIEEVLKKKGVAQNAASDVEDANPSVITQDPNRVGQELQRILVGNSIDFDTHEPDEKSEILLFTPRTIEESEADSITRDIAHRITKRRSKQQMSAPSKKGERRTQQQTVSLEEDDAIDYDEYIPAPVDHERRSERLKDKYAAELDDLERKDSLWNSAIEEETYSYKWFKSLIQLESLSDARKDSTKTELVITFGRVGIEPGTSRTLVLEQPNRSIPQEIEDLSNIPLVLSYGDKSRSVEIEVASAKTDVLLVKLKDGADISGIDLSSVYEAKIEIKNPTFLLEELRKRFVGLGLANAYNMRDNLPENIDFIFGPPGTGKTTYLADEILVPFMSQTENLRVLVLTPTNKAADVLTHKVIDCSSGIAECKQWLVRFGTTASEELEISGIHRDKTFDFSSLVKSVTITTVARFPYDYYMTESGHEYLRDMDWDYVVIDEASMVSCAYITYVLHCIKPRQFYIAGDPNQIAPVVKVDLWKDENIYTMTQLRSFTNPQTVPHNYKITLLKTQYRSVPAIGSVFSNYAYGGMLHHARQDSKRLRSYLGGLLGRKPINIIKFPVSSYESIYRPKHLRGGSSYQPYSALLTYELVRYLASLFSEQSRAASIGVVSPYKAQANLIQGLLAQTTIPNGINVQAGTIHGFQGDECDVMIVVLNPPPKISGSKDMFLNKRNILNVSVSRARDSLILLVPNDDMPRRSQLVEVNRLEQICLKTGEAATIPSELVEEMVFCNPNHIAENSFSTGHQAVNVYGNPEQRYEIRSEEQAVDIQVHYSVPIKQ